jgi:hypothetical protein
MCRVRSLPGLQNFQMVKAVADLAAAAQHTTVVILSVHTTRCDALASLKGSSTVTHVPLESFSYERAREAQAQLLVPLRDMPIPGMV